MPATKSAIRRYLAIDRVLGSPPDAMGCSLRDLQLACEEAIAYDGSTDSGLSLRTLRYDIAFMRSEAGYMAPIETEKTNRGYFYRYADPDFSILKRPMTTSELDSVRQMVDVVERLQGISELAVLDELGPVLQDKILASGDKKPLISYQANEGLRGVNSIHPLYRHCKEKDVLEVTYEPFGKEAATSIFHPWYLKQYNNRWFLFGFDQDKPELSVTNKAVDRIKDFKKIDSLEHKACKIDWKEYFKDVVGVTKPEGAKPEKVVLKFSSNRAPYVKTKPIHPSQREKDLPGGGLEVTLNVIVNNELKAVLYGFGPDLEVRSGIEL